MSVFLRSPDSGHSHGNHDTEDVGRFALPTASASPSPGFSSPVRSNKATLNDHFLS